MVKGKSLAVFLLLIIFSLVVFFGLFEITQAYENDTPEDLVSVSASDPRQEVFASGDEYNHSHDENKLGSKEKPAPAKSWWQRGWDFIVSLFGGKKDDASDQATLNKNHDIDTKNNALEANNTSVLSQIFADDVSPDDMKNATVITYKDGRYEPDIVHISAGRRVLWINESDFFWPAANLHPTHKQYPGSNIIKCRAKDRVLIFDACDNLGPKAGYSFIFNQIGEWKYHDHIDPRAVGTIVVAPITVN